MLARFLQQIYSSVGVVFRTFRAFFTRQFMGVRARIRRITSFSRQAARLIPKAMSSLAVAGQKPSSRKDFIETKRLFVAKSLLVMLVVGLVVLILFLYFIAWPWLVSRFFTAHLYQEDDKLPAYNGRVVVYHDEEKTIPKLEGKLTEGLAQGEGSEYDEDGLLAYEGSFVDGKRQGTGRLYEAGVLCYEGQFAAGLPDGQGTAFYPSGSQEYSGAFSQGVYEGEGTLYYEDGQVRYKGQFSNGSFEGQGRLYQEDGTLLYEGNFQEGTYSGEGKLHLSSGLRLEAEFEDGVPVGEVSIYRQGKINYQGEVEDLVPNGLGTLYASDGTPIYTGPMAQGFPDYRQLLQLTGEDIRAVFAEAKLEETPEETGFSIRNEALGVTFFCSYKTEESDPQVQEIYCYNQQADSFAQAMPWESREDFERQVAVEETLDGEETTAFLADTPFRDGPYTADVYALSGCTLRGWSQEEDPEEWCMVQWSAAAETAAGGETAEEDQPEEPGFLDDLLTGLEDQEEDGTIPSGSGAVETGGETFTPNRDDPTQEELSPVVDYYLQVETVWELANQLSLKQSLLQLLEEQDRMGKGDPQLLEELQTQVPQLEVRAGQAVVERERLELENRELESLEYSGIITALLHSPAEFGQAALQAANASRKDELQLTELELAWKTAQQAKAAYEKAEAAAQKAETDYKTGAVDEIAWKQAQCAQSEAVVQLHQAIHDYAKAALAFNTAVDGYLSAQYGWDQLLDQ